MSATMEDFIAKLKEATPARVGQGRTGGANLTREQLEFQFAHARARDAVHRPLDFEELESQINYECVKLQSASTDRHTYLRRPDLGRSLSAADKKLIKAQEVDLAFAIADGLSSDGVQNHAASLLNICLEALKDFKIAPVYLVSQARVAVGDEIGEALGARLVIMLVGERPGLTVADSLGVYITHGPKVGRKDSERNCISNIHNAGGLSYSEAAMKIDWLVRQSLKLGLSGTSLKEDAGSLLKGDGKEKEAIEP